MRRWLAGALIFIGLTGSAHAQQATAEDLFRAGRKLMETRQYAEACDKFAESQRLESRAGTLLNLADCLERNGQLPASWRTFKEARAAAALRGRNDWVTTATSRAAALEAKLAMITITVAPGASELQDFRLQRDGVAVPREDWGSPMAVEPGPHTIEASAPRYKTWTRHVTVASSEAARADVPALEPLPAGPAQTAAPADTERRSGSAMRIAGFAIGGVGIAALAVGTFAGVRALSLRGSAQFGCNAYPNGCDEDAFRANDDARTFATISTITLAAGGALLVAGAVLVIVSNRSDAARSALRLAPTGLGGRF